MKPTFLQSALYLLLVFLMCSVGYSQDANHSFSFTINVDEEVAEDFNQNGRIFIFLSKNPYAEPRSQTWPSPVMKTYIFAKNIKGFNPKNQLELSPDNSWDHTSDWKLDNVPSGDYYVQILWDQNTVESNINAAGNLYSEKQKITIDASATHDFILSRRVLDRSIAEHELVRLVDIKSEILSDWWGKEMRLKASVLLPHNHDVNKSYPIRYNVAGYGGRYDRINRFARSAEFMTWWDSDEAPQLINVFLDGEGPFGDSYQLDSENSGPYGQALVEELIPYIEEQYRGSNSAKYRFVDGCSTGGWVSLALQLYYPEIFNGAFSYSPDAIAFENYQLTNIYKDANTFVNEYGYERPVMRDINGEPMLSMREFIRYENILGTSGTYLNSGGQFSAHTALYSPKGEDGLPKPMFDPYTGEIDQTVTEHWKKYDLKLYAKDNWETLGPKIQGKIYIWMGDMDHFYLNPGTREFDAFIKSTDNPVSDAVIEYSAMEGHCSMFDHEKVMNQIMDRIKDVDSEK